MRRTWGLLLWALIAAAGACDRSEPPPGPETSKVIGAAGGMISVPGGGVALSVPAGALAEDRTLTIEELLDPAPGAVGRTFELGPDGLAFAVPATLGISYAPRDLGGRPAGALRLASYDGTRWWPVPDCVVNLDPASPNVSARIAHLSTWALVIPGEVGVPSAQGSDAP